jgi:hypothetical protein
MRKGLFLILVLLGGTFGAVAQINYTFSTTTSTYSYVSGGTTLTGQAGNMGINDEFDISVPTNIGFTFQFGCTNYTTFQAGTSGVMFLGTNITYSDDYPNLSGNSDRPIIAPLWDIMETYSTGSKVNYLLSGTSPNRVLTVEWKKMLWEDLATSPVISFQVKLYETSNRIEFWYKQEGGAVDYGAAAIGIGGVNSGDFYSLNNSGSSPTASKTTETDTISVCPATNQVYRFDPTLCSGTPSAPTSVANPAVLCAAGTTTLSLSGYLPCGMTYQWQQSTTGSGGWSNISGATSSTQTVSVPSTGMYYQCIVICTSSSQSVTSSTVHVSIGSPSNDDCSGAISLSIGSCATGDVTCATQSKAGCTGTADDDIWYKFTATSTSQNIIVSAGSSFDPVVQVYSGACGGLTSIWCEDATYTSGGVNECKQATGLTVGSTYYVRVYDYYTGTPSTPNFTLCITDPTANYSCNLNYSYTTTTFSLDAGVTTAVPNMQDDYLSDAVSLGFGFCYDGFLYTQAYISSNAALVFDAVDPCNGGNIDQPRVAASNGGYTGYSIAKPIPTKTDYTPQNAILAPWHDIDPGNGGTITYATLGTSPNRRFVVYYNSVKQFETSSPCQNTNYDYIGQIKLFETSNNIEIHVQQMNSCTIWNNGQAILGLHNPYGTIAVVPAGYNANASSPYNQYSISNTAWRFTTTCSACAIILPIEIKSFSAEIRNEFTNEIKLVTVTEKDVQWFHVERSMDAVNFTLLAKLQPKSNEGAEYVYDDDLTESDQTYYYRIGTENFDGTMDYSGIRAVARSHSGNISVFNAYPNPFTDELNIDVESVGSNHIQVEAFGVLGRKVFSRTLDVKDGSSHVILGEMPGEKGLYLLRLTDEAGNLLYEKKLLRE